MIHIKQEELEYFESAITNLESGQPVQYKTENLRSLLEKVRKVKRMEETFTNLLDHVSNNFEERDYQLEATPENIKFADEAEQDRYGNDRAPLHVHEGFIWTTDKILFDYFTTLAEGE